MLFSASPFPFVSSNRRLRRVFRVQWALVLWAALLCAALLPGACIPDPNARYVSPDGDDANDGTFFFPWRTLAKAAASLQPGETVYIRGGTYSERLLPQTSGTEGHPITYAAYPGERAVIDGSSITLPSFGGLVEISGRSYITIRGIVVQNAGPYDNSAGVLIEDSHHITVEEVHTYNTVSSGIGVWNSSYVTLMGNEVRLACNNGEEECISIAGTSHFTVRDNRVYEGGPGTKGGEGIDVKDGSSYGEVSGNLVHHLNRVGIYVDAWDKHTHRIDVYGNIVHHCAGDGFSVASEEGGLLEEVRIFNNLAYDNTENGLALSEAGDADTHPVQRVEIVNNTFYRNGSPSWGGGISIENAWALDILIRNNICSRNVVYQIQVEVPVSGLRIDHNLIDGYRNYEDETRGTDWVEGDPRFLDAAGADFHIRSDSPAVDTGNPSNAPDKDLDGMHRPYGPGVDIGAYEYVPETSGESKD